MLVVAQVRSRKSNGSLYLMGKRLAWQEDNKEVFTVSHYYADVKRKYKIGSSSLSITRDKMNSEQTIDNLPRYS